MSSGRSCQPSLAQSLKEKMQETHLQYAEHAKQTDKSKGDGSLVRMLERTSLTTQKMTHSDIERIGCSLHEQSVKSFLTQQQLAVKRAEEEAVKVTTQKFERLLAEQAEEARVRKETELAEMKAHYEDLAELTRVNRDQKEANLLRELELRMTREKEEELRQQWDRANKRQEGALYSALKQQYTDLCAKAAQLCDATVTRAVQRSRDDCARRSESRVEEERRKCAEVYRDKLAAHELLHQAQILRLKERIAMVTNRKPPQGSTRTVVETNDDTHERVQFARITDFHQSARDDALPVAVKVTCRVQVASTQTNLIGLDQHHQLTQT